MTPQAQGRHCAKCAHVVADLTRASDAELVALFTGDARPKCARFDPAQLDRALSNRSENRNASLPIAAFSSLLAVAAGNEVIAQSPAAPRKLVGEAAISRPAPPPPVVMGKMMMPSPPPDCSNPMKGEAALMPEHQLRTGQARITGDTIVAFSPVDPGTSTQPAHRFVAQGRLIEEGSADPVAFATVQVEGNESIRALTDLAGLFELTLPEDLRNTEFSLIISAPGYEPRTIPFHAASAVHHRPVVGDRQPYRVLRKINGRVIDAANNSSIVDATVVLKGTSTAGVTDEYGMFGFDPPNAERRPSCVLIVSANGYAEVEFPLSSDHWPLAGTLKLEKADTTSPGPPTTPEGSLMLGDVALTPVKQEFLGLMVVTREPSTWQKMTRRLRNMVR